jgi:hypothetical protein
MPREALYVYSKEELETWHRPKEDTVHEKHRSRYSNASSAMSAVLLGEVTLSAAAERAGLCRKRLRSMIDRAPRMAADGRPYGFRVCVPWGSYCKSDIHRDISMPKRAAPHAMEAVLELQPNISEWVNGFSHPLPPGRPPRAFNRLHDRMVAELKRLDLHDFYPLNQPDQGKRALLRLIRTRRIETAPMPDMDVTGDTPQSALAGIFNQHPYDRIEIDGHRIDIEAKYRVHGPKGRSVTKKITALWILAAVECESRAIVGWVIRAGRSYDSLDFTHVVANCMRPWMPRDLTIPNLMYVPGAGMPTGLSKPLGFRRCRMAAVDNAKAHHAFAFEQAFCRSHDGVLTFGRPHQPRTRPIIEQLFSRLEKGAFRLIAGGFEPATKLGENKLRISNFSPDEHPIQLHLLEELIDVIIANYNATPHPSLGDRTPLEFLQQREFNHLWFYEPSDAEACANDMNSIIVRVRVNGNRKSGEMPHINYCYVRYRSPELDGRWELVGKTLTARVCRDDLRTLVLLQTATKPVGVLRASAPWSMTRHDETTRKLIYQWGRQKGGLKIAGVDCAIDAYIQFLRKIASTSQPALDQLARIQQQHPTSPDSSKHPLMNSPVRGPARGWFSMDEMLD